MDPGECRSIPHAALGCPESLREEFRRKKVGLERIPARASLVMGVSTTVRLIPMSMKTYSGSCHCGAVRFQAELDLAEGTVKCNCSSCTKARSWIKFTPADRFRLLKGEEAQAEYQWTPPGRANPMLQFYFCKRCGISHSRARRSRDVGRRFLRRSGVVARRP